MGAFGRMLLAAWIGVGSAVPAQSQQAKPSPDQDIMKRDRPTAPKVLTGKERLGPKWTDEQRIDNCNVPVEKRGTKPRSSACAQATSGF